MHPRTNTSDPDLGAKLKRLAPLAAALVLILLILAFRNVYNARNFRVVSTNPDPKNVATLTPFFKVAFNKPLSSNNIIASVSPDALSSYHIEGDTLVINFNNPMDAGKTYTVTIGRIYDTAHESITNKKFTFVPKNIPYDRLPVDQQQAAQKQAPNENDQQIAPTLEGTAPMVDDGLTAAQVNSLAQAFVQFAPKSKAVVIDTNSISPVPHDPTSTNVYDTINFSVTVDGTPYTAHINYWDLTTIELFVNNPQTGAQVFDSGPVVS